MRQIRTGWKDVEQFVIIKQKKLNLVGWQLETDYFPMDAIFEWTGNCYLHYFYTLSKILFLLSDYWPVIDLDHFRASPSAYSTSISTWASSSVRPSVCLLSSKNKKTPFIWCLLDSSFVHVISFGQPRPFADSRTHRHEHMRLCVRHSGVLPSHRPETSGFHNIWASLWAGVKPHWK